MSAHSTTSGEHVPAGTGGGACFRGFCRSGRADWSGGNLIAMIVGFVLFWPLGLFLLFWIMSGRMVRDLPQAVRSAWQSLKTNWGGRDYNASGNQVFNEYQQTQFEKIREIREEIANRASRFNAFRRDVQRRKDQEEFDRFMSGQR